MATSTPSIRLTFALLIGASLMVACTSTPGGQQPPVIGPEAENGQSASGKVEVVPTSTSGGVPSSAVSPEAQSDQPTSGKVDVEPTLSPNAGAVMLVIDSSGDGTPVPMYAITPAASVPPRPAATAVADKAALATEWAQQDPRILTLEGAQVIVPFQFKLAEYVPEGYELDQWAMILEGYPPSYGNEVKGVPWRTRTAASASERDARPRLSPMPYPFSTSASPLPGQPAIAGGSIATRH